MSNEWMIAEGIAGIPTEAYINWALTGKDVAFGDMTSEQAPTVIDELMKLNLHSTRWAIAATVRRFPQHAQHAFDALLKDVSSENYRLRFDVMEEIGLAGPALGLIAIQSLKKFSKIRVKDLKTYAAQPTHLAMISIKQIGVRQLENASAAVDALIELDERDAPRYMVEIARGHGGLASDIAKKMGKMKGPYVAGNLGVIGEEHTECAPDIIRVLKKIDNHDACHAIGEISRVQFDHAEQCFRALKQMKHRWAIAEIGKMGVRNAAFSNKAIEFLQTKPDSQKAILFMGKIGVANAEAMPAAIKGLMQATSITREEAAQWISKMANKHIIAQTHSRPPYVPAKFNGFLQVVRDFNGAASPVSSVLNNAVVSMVQNVTNDATSVIEMTAPSWDGLTKALKRAARVAPELKEIVPDFIKAANLMRKVNRKVASVLNAEI